MKRSRTATLLLMGSAPLLFTACQQREEAVLFGSVAECTASGAMSRAQCEEGFLTAQAEHERVAPRYVNREDCLRDFGPEQCEPARQSSGMFMPLMAGMMMGRMMGGGAAGLAPQPVYRPRGGEWQTPGGIGVGNRTGAVQVPRQALQPQARATTMSRSGFGQRARSTGSWGG
jgi:uncharacterized protein YgiB involved in biofilm formation